MDELSPVRGREVTTPLPRATARFGKRIIPPNATDVWSIKKVNPQSMIHQQSLPTRNLSISGLYSFYVAD